MRGPRRAGLPLRGVTALAVPLALGVLWVLAAACGGPRAGESCSGSAYRCEDGSSALECRAGRWVALPCRGPGGCATVDGTVRCDLRGNLEADPCPLSAEGLALCGREGRSLLECREGTFVMALSCLSCSEGDGGVRCVQ